METFIDLSHSMRGYVLGIVVFCVNFIYLIFFFRKTIDTLFTNCKIIFIKCNFQKFLTSIYILCKLVQYWLICVSSFTSEGGGLVEFVGKLINILTNLSMHYSLLRFNLNYKTKTVNATCSLNSEFNRNQCLK